jgi:hypothetical protein
MTVAAPVTLDPVVVSIKITKPTTAAVTGITTIVTNYLWRNEVRRENFFYFHRENRNRFVSNPDLNQTLITRVLASRVVSMVGHLETI